MMRLMLKTAICIGLLWLGAAGLVDSILYKGDVTHEIDEIRMGSNVSALFDGQSLLSVPISYASDVERMVYLTFDDGPSKNTLEVLDILDKAEVKGTFFVLGKQVVKYPEITKRILKEGHSIGNHTFNHKYEELYGSSFGKFAEQVMATDEAIYKATGTRTNLVRAPGGTYSNFDQGYFDALAAAGYLVHDWNVDSGDSKRRGVPADEIIKAVKDSKLLDKVVVLMHDGEGHEESAKALPSIITYYKSKGYRFAALTEEVKPIQFRIAEQLKWDRAEVKPSEAALLADYVKQGDKGATSAKEQPELIIHIGDEELTFGTGEYTIVKGAVQVSLRKLAEGIGGKVQWDRQSGVVKVTRGSQLFEVNSLIENGGTAMPNQVMVPLRTMLQSFDIEISRYVMTDSQREIWTDIYIEE
ncbi:MAG: polysaccharide deacetylase family protein [Candidatus Pristimantibacillus sp.]